MAKDPGQPSFFEGLALPESVCFPLGGRIGHLSLRNTGINTLWISFDDKTFFDIASGTSYDEDVDIQSFYAKTQNGHTTFVCNGVIWH